MRFWVHAALASTALLGISTVAQAETVPVVLEPSSPWNVDFAPTSCRLSRVFGGEGDRHLLFFEQHYPSSLSGVTAAGPAFDRFRGGARTYVSTSDAQEPFRTKPYAGDIAQIGRGLIYSSLRLEYRESQSETPGGALPQLDTEFAGTVDYVSLRQGRREVRFKTGQLDEAFAVLNSCTQDMVRDWGLDVDQHLTATRRPQWTNQNSVTRRIQSAAASGLDRRGILRLRVIVDEEGKVEQCKIDTATDNDLVSPACRIMEAARFEPALDAEGNPFRSFFATGIVYLSN